MFLSVEVAKNPEADHASARWRSLPSSVPILGPEGPCGYQVKPEARLHCLALDKAIGGSCGDAELPSFWCVCRAAAGATENEASCLSTGERLNRWPFACGRGS